MDNTLVKAVRDYATKNGIDEAGLLSVVEVESSGTPLWKVGGKNLPPIRFEGHYFFQRLTGTKLQEAINQGLAHRKAGEVKNPRSFADRYTFLERAKKIDHKAALESTSWGAGQVMGAHWKSLGYDSVDDLVTAASTVTGQVDMIVRFLKWKNLIPEVNNQNWDKVAYYYNGSNYKAGQYHIKLANAYKRWKSGNQADYVAEDLSSKMMVQTMLNAVGNYGLEVDGNHGPKTKAAIMDFQIKNGLTSDGIYGPITKEELESDYKALTTQKQDVVAKISAASGVAGVALSEAAKTIEPLAGTSQWMQYLFLGLTVAGVIFTLKTTIFGK